MTMQLGCVIPNSGPLLSRTPLAEAVAVVEEGGANSIWFSDHLVMMENPSDAHPYSPSAKEQVDRVSNAAADWNEVLTCMAYAAACTDKLRIGTAVLVLPQRNTVEIAKVCSTLDRLSKGRCVLGVGAGWLRDEFEFVGYDFDSRYPRLEEQVRLLREYWTNPRQVIDGKAFYLTPAPEYGVPLLLGGNKPQALRRAARLGDGWLGLAMDYTSYVEETAEQLAILQEAGAGIERPFQRVIRLAVKDRNDEDGLLTMFSELVGLGFDEMIIEPSWESADRVINLLAETRKLIPAAS
jgi:probable F420-dependent oxidoreductase